MTGLLAIIQPPPLDLGLAEVLVALSVCAVIFAITGKKLRDDIRRWTGA